MGKTVIHFRLAHLRKSKHITQEELAEAVGTSFQTISKWENGITMPDITMLPVLASCFDVSVDQLLGLKPLPNETHIPEETGSETFWDNHLEYLIHTRQDTWNSDYMTFLVREVWKIDRPVKVLDCGCGFGFLAALLMPCLPRGSTYTGIDFSEVMVRHAEKLLKQYSIAGEIKKEDFLSCNLRGKYDFVICQSVLRHLGDSRPFIRKMLDCAAADALIVCTDGNRELECCGLYVDGMDYGYLCDHTGAIRHWEAERSNAQRDYAAAMRSAYVMRELGLTDIDIRMNDKVSFICPEQPDYDTKIQNFIAHKESWYTDANAAIERLINHGMTGKEAENYVSKSFEICDYVKKHKGTAALTQFLGETITFGWKRG